MVKKIAVIALVAIVAVPILLGYAFNLTPTTVTEYNNSKDPVNVTPLLYNDVEYNSAHASIYDLNTVFRYGNVPVNPIYVEVGSNQSIFPLTQATIGTINLSLSLHDWSDVFTFLHNDYHGVTTGNVRLVLRDTSNVVVLTVDHVKDIYYEVSTLSIYYSYYPNANDLNSISFGNYTAGSESFVMGLSSIGTNTVDTLLQLGRSYATTYVNLSKGFYFTGTPSQWYIDIPNYAKSLIITVDLDTVADSDYAIMFTTLTRVIFVKTTVDGNVTWTVQYNDNNNNPIEEKQIYYNPSGDNTYQLEYHYTDTGNDGVDYNYHEQLDLHYVGDWPTLMGLANSYIDYTFNADLVYNTPVITSSVTLNSNKSYTPIMRVDDAEYRAMAYQILQNITYDPSQFRTNPSTTITNISLYGTSLDFGGSTFAVTDGNITLGTHQISVSKCVFKSIPVAGGYQNRINDVVISTTAQPSQIVFNGRWAASVATDTMVQNTYNKTEWTPGEFGWNGIDQNFLIVGLITCIGVFIALGIYARKSRSGGIIPLMIITGCAGMLFFVML